MCAPDRTRWVPGSAPDAFGMPFPPRRAGSSLSQLLEHSRRRLKCARSRWPADPQERTDALCSDSPASSPGRAHGAWAGHAGCRRRRLAAGDPARRSLGSWPWVGEGGPADPFLPFLLQLSVGLLCFPFVVGRVRLLAALAQAPSLPRTLAFRPGLFRFSSSLDRLPFFPHVDPREKLLLQVCQSLL